MLSLLVVISVTAFAVAPEPDSHEKTGNCWIINHLEKSGGTTIRRIVNPPRGRRGKNPIPYYSREWRRGDNFASQLVPRLGDEVTFLSGGYAEAL